VGREVERAEARAGKLASVAPGRQAELFVADRIGCPSCGSALRLLPTNYPLYDIACGRCVLRAQVKRILAMPRDRIRGASWEVMSHHFKTGHLIPPMFACFGWPAQRHEPSVVWFFPLIPIDHVTRRVLSDRHQTPGRRMTEYVRMRELPHLTVFESTDPGPPPA
jgi:hypothetical protein